MDIPVSYTNFNPFTYVNNGCTYILYNLSDIGTTAGSIQFTIPAGTIYMAIQGFPGSAGSSDGDGGGGGGGSGGFFNGTINNTTSGTILYVNVAYPSISLSNENDTSTYFSVPYGSNGYNGSSGSSGSAGNGGNGGSWTSQLSSVNIPFSNFTANGGGGGGGGNNNNKSSGNGAGGTGGTSAGYTGNTTEPTTDFIGYYTFLDDAYGLNGAGGGSVGSGATLYNFLDSSNELMEAGQGAYFTNTSLATNGSFPYIMFYYQTADTTIDDPTTIAYSSNYTFLYPTTTTTSPVNLSVSQYTITGTTIAQTQTAVNCISNTSYNPLTYAVPDNWTYSMIYCPTCTSTTDTTTDTTTTTYYEATWTVPSSGTYYWAGIGPGGTANINGNYYDGDATLFGVDGGSGNGCFVTGQLINNNTYTFQMYDTTVTTTMPIDNSTYTHQSVNATTYNTLFNGTNSMYMYMYGGGIGGCGAESSDYDSDGMYGGDGGTGGTTTYSSGASVTDFFTVSTFCSGSGGGGGSCAGGVQSTSNSGLGGTHGTTPTDTTYNTIYTGENGTNGNYQLYVADSALYVGSDDMINTGQGGMMNLSF